MAITLADFTKIWASTSPLTPYSFSESNYKEGWNFIGSTPPARQMWDSIQNQNDEKLKYIVDNFLPLDGSSKMTGAVSFDEQGEIGFRGTTHTDPSEVCKQLVATAGTVDSAWDDGNAKLCLHTYDNTGTNTEENGAFVLQASDGNGNSPYLEGKPNGDLEWSGKGIERVSASGSDYIRYESGIQICFGKTENLSSANADTYTDITLPASFINTDYSVSLTTYVVSGGWNNHSFAIGNKTTTSMRAYLRNLNSTAYVCYFMYIAIGKWK